MAAVPSREPSSTTMHSQDAWVWRWMLRRDSSMVAPASKAVLSVIRLLNLEQFLAIYESQEAALSVVK